MQSFFRHIGLAAITASFLSGNALAADATKGKAAYVKNGCFQCHGFVAQGGAAVKLAPQPMPYEAFSNFVRTARRAMPPYSEQILSNDDLADIYAYVASIPAPTDYKTIPLLSQ
jgi:ubiquinol-cytochrome c reductase cytochrome c subunit